METRKSKLETRESNREKRNLKSKMETQRWKSSNQKMDARVAGPDSRKKCGSSDVVSHRGVGLDGCQF
eukprot:489074-Rhodomonas_salina.1